MLETFTQAKKSTSPVGKVVKLGSDLLWVEGLPNLKNREIVVFENGTYGRVMKVEENSALIMNLGSQLDMKSGMEVVGLGKSLEIEAGKYLLGSSVDSLGREVSGKVSGETKFYSVEHSPMSLRGRALTDERFDTGQVVVDLMVPLAKGQRELIIGDRKTGKTHFVMKTILAQAKQGTVCVYVAVGKSQSDIKTFELFFRKHGVEKQIVLVQATMGQSAGQIFLAPYTGMAIAEYFRDQGQNSMLVIDDMNTHAEYYRQLALEAKVFPGKEAYPGDIFYLHSKLMERAGSFEVEKSKVNITCLPVVGTVQDGLSGYIQTNLMSMTDGHLFFDEQVSRSGRWPAVNTLLSVTRVGRQTQNSLEHELTNKLLQLMSDYQVAKGYLKFGAELSPTLQLTLDRGDILEELLTQVGFDLMDRDLSTLLTASIFADKPAIKILENRQHAFTSNADYKKTVQDSLNKATDLESFLKSLPAIKPSTSTSGKGSK